MPALTRDHLEPLLCFFDAARESASFPLHLPELGCTVVATVEVPMGSSHLNDKSIATLNDAVQLTPAAHHRLRELLFEHAMRDGFPIAVEADPSLGLLDHQDPAAG